MYAPHLRVLAALCTLACALALVPPDIAHAQEEWDVRGGDARTREIIRRYQSLLERNPTEGLALRKLIELTGKGSGLERLIGQYEQKVEAKPEDVRLWIVLGHLYKEKARYADAERAYGEALSREDKSALAYLGRGAARMMMDKPKEAQADFEAALEHERDRAKRQDILRKLADLAFAQRDWARAQTYYDRLIELDPRNEYLRMEYAQVLVKYKRYDKALEQYEALVELAGRDVKTRATTLRDMGDLYEKMGDEERAISAYKKAMSYVRPGNWLYREVQQRIIGVYRRTERLEEYLAKVSKRWRRPNFDQAMLLASLYDELAREEEALKFYETARSKNRRAVEPRLKIIQIRTRRGEMKAVARAYDDLIRVAPSQARFRFDLAKLHFRNGDRKKAQAVLRATRSKFRREPDVLVTLADMYLRFGMRDEALGVYKSLVRAEPGNDSFILSLGEYYYQNGEVDKALKTWERILKSSLPKAEAHALLGNVLVE
ncbi:MAG: tetratricopeptide repeat protein, partial [Myxococcota bacterium]